MKIYHVLPKSKLGGAETAVFSSVDYLNQRGVDFKIITIEKSEDYSHVDSKFIIKLNGSIFNPMCYFRFINTIKKTKPDMVVFSLWKSSLFGLVMKSWFFFSGERIKTSLIIHSSKFSHWLDFIVTKIGINVFDKIYFDSLSAQEALSTKNHCKDMVLSFSTRDITPKPFNSLPQKVNFVFVGRLHKVKNISYSIDFIKSLVNLGVDVKYDIFGPDEGELEIIKRKIAMLNLNDTVSYKGILNNNEVIGEIKKYNFYLQLSEYEGMAMSVVESIKAGLIPCVTSVGEIPSYANDDYNAVLFNVKHIHDSNYLNEMALRVQKIINDNTTYQQMFINCSKTFMDSKSYKEDYYDKVIVKN